MNKDMQKRVCSLLLILCMVCNLFAGLPVTVAAATSGVILSETDLSAAEDSTESGLSDTEGTMSDTESQIEIVEIRTAEELAALSDADTFANISEKKIVLTNDIDMTGVNMTPIGGRNAFEGIFDGQGRVIRNLTILGSEDCTGLFGYLGVNGQILNLGLENVTVTGGNNTGGLVGCLTGTVSQCYVTGSISGEKYTGGIAGVLHAGTIENCFVDVAVNAAGAGGSLFGGTAYNGLNKAGSPIAARITDKKHIVKNNLMLGTVEGSGYIGGVLGDLSGNTYGSLCEAFTGNVISLNSVTNGSTAAGKLYGFWSGSSYVQIPTTDHENVYWADMSSSNANDLTYANVTSRTTEELDTQSTYEALGWDFETVWMWSEELGHPVLMNVTEPAVPAPVYQTTPASLITTFAGDARTTRAFTWYTDTVVTETVVQAVPADMYTDEADFTGSNAIVATGTCEELQITEAGEMRNIHQVNLTGLTAGTSYCYRAGDGGENWSPVYTFTTEPENTEEFTFYSIADTQSGSVSNTVNYKNYAHILDVATKENPEGAFILHAGDVIQNNLTEHYDAVYNYISEYSPWLPSMVTAGNHETEKDWSKEEDAAYGVDNPNYVKGVANFNSHYLFPDNGPEGANQMIYSFDYGNAHFAVLNSSTKTSLPTADQIEWLRADMNASDKTWKIVSIHVGPYNTYGQSSVALCNAMDELGVDLVMFGHNHVFMRSNPIKNSVAGEPGMEGTVYYSSGSANGSGTINDKGKPWFVATISLKQPMYGVIKVTADTLTIETRTIVTTDLESGSSLIDEYTITKKEAVASCEPPVANVLKNNGLPQELVTAGAATGGTMMYSLDRENWSEAIPTAVDAGTYTVWYKVEGDSEHYNTMSQSITVTIEPRAEQAALTITSDVNMNYSKKLALSVSGGSTNGEVTYTVTSGTGEATVENGILTPVKPGTVTVVATMAGDLDYYDVTSEAVTITIYDDRAEVAAEEAKAAQAAAEEAQAKAEAAQAAAETAQAGAENAKAQAEAAQAAAAEAQAKAEAAQAKAEDAAASSAVDKAAAEDAAKAAQEAQAKAEAAQNAAETAQNEAEAAQVKAENAAASAEAAKAAAVAAQNAAEDAAKAAEESNAEAATEAAKAAQSAAEAANNAAKAAESEAESAVSASQAAVSATNAAQSASDAAASAANAAEAYQKAQEAQAKAEAAQAEAEKAKEEAEAAKKEAEEAAKEAAEYKEALEKEAAEMMEEALAALKAAQEAQAKAEAAQKAAEEVQKAIEEAIKEANCPSKKFTDIEKGVWYHDAVDYVISNNLMSGYTDSTFAPGQALTRAMLVQIIYNMEGKPVVDAENQFTDVVDGAWYYNAVTWATENGIVSGYTEESFGPEDKITREQLVSIFWRYADKPESESEEIIFDDIDLVDAYAVDAVIWAVENGIISGMGNNLFAPDNASTRAEAAKIMQSYCTYINNN